MSIKNFIQQFANNISSNNNKISLLNTFTWDPSLLGGDLVAHWKSDSGVALSGTNVTTWTDQVNSIVATPTNSPIFTETNIAVKDQATIDMGTNLSYFSVPDSLINSFDGESQATALVLFRRKNSASEDPLFELTVSGTSVKLFATLEGNGTSVVSARSNSGDGEQLVTGTFTSTDWAVLELSVDLSIGNVSSYVNNEVTGTNGSATFGSSTFSTSAGARHNLMASVSGSGDTPGDFEVAEILFIKKTLTQLERDYMAFYFNNKYGLSMPYLEADLGGGADPDPDPYPGLDPSFLPSDIPNLTLWLDGSDDSNITESSGDITAWIDKSPNAFVGDISPVPPTRTAVKYNGLKTVHFNGEQSLESLANWIHYRDDLSKALNGQPGLSLFIVFNPIAYPGVEQTIFDTWLSTSSTKYRFYTHNTFAAYSFMVDSFDSSGSRKIQEYGTMRENELQLWESIVDLPGRTITMKEEGVVPTLSVNEVNFTKDVWDVGDGYSTGAGTGRNDSIGAESNSDNTGGDDPFYGDIAEIVFFNRNVTTLEANNMRNFLANKWGITLP